MVLSFTGIEPIREDDVYGGYRVSVILKYDTIRTPMQIDVTTGDVITPQEVQYLFKMIFKEGIIDVLAYNVETILAEKRVNHFSCGITTVDMEPLAMQSASPAASQEMSSCRTGYYIAHSM